MKVKAMVMKIDYKLVFMFFLGVLIASIHSLAADDQELGNSMTEAQVGAVACAVPGQCLNQVYSKPLAQASDQACGKYRDLLNDPEGDCGAKSKSSGGNDGID